MRSAPDALRSTVELVEVLSDTEGGTAVSPNASELVEAVESSVDAVSLSVNQKFIWKSGFD